MLAHRIHCDIQTRFVEDTMEMVLFEVGDGGQTSFHLVWVRFSRRFTQ